MKCIMCEKEVKINLLKIIDSADYDLCVKCLNELEVINIKKAKKLFINNHPLTCELQILFQYNEFSKQYLYKLKEKGDIELIKLLTPYIKDIMSDNKEYVFIPVRSSDETYNKRKFHINEEILTNVKKEKVINGPKRLDDLKQGKLTLKDRQTVKHKYKKIKIEEENIIVFDDVIVSGKTIEQFISNIEFQNLNSLKILVLFQGQYSII